MKEVNFCQKTLEETKSKTLVYEMDLESSMIREEFNELDTPIWKTEEATKQNKSYTSPPSSENSTISNIIHKKLCFSNVVRGTKPRAWSQKQCKISYNRSTNN